MRAPIVVALVLSLAAAPAVGEDLPTFLKAASAAARPTAALRADGTLVTTSPDGTVRDQIAIVRRPNGDLYVELREAGTRALLLADGDKALLVPAKGKRSEPFALDASLGGSEFTREDMRPFNVQNYQSPTIVDRRNGEVTVSLTPNAGSQYSLQVITFDSERKVPLIVKNYKETISNLVKMRRSRNFTSAGGTWVPSEIAMENFPLRSNSALTLSWRQTEDVPTLFDPAALDKPSPLTWPAQQAAPATQ
jgi:outer membrane lipoprotein-sorting protein